MASHRAITTSVVIQFSGKATIPSPAQQIASYPTTLPLMRAFVDKAVMEGNNGALSVFIERCFPYVDMQELSGRVLMTANKDKAEADRLATEIGRKFISMRSQTTPDYLSLEARTDTANRVQRQPGRDGRLGR